MPTNHTPNYQLSQWERDDRVLMDDFNADNAKIDAALGTLAGQVSGKADASALAAVSQSRKMPPAPSASPAGRCLSTWAGLMAPVSAPSTARPLLRAMLSARCAPLKSAGPGTACPGMRRPPFTR